MPVTEAPVLVTGATGFVAAEIVKQLLEADYTVRGTTRDVAKSETDGYLAALSGAGERLELVQADLGDPGAFDVAASGCQYVMHTASPFVLDVEDPQRDLVDPAVNGTRSVLESVSRARGVRRVVLTSSFAAMSGAPKDGVWSEADWNADSSLDFGAYAYSKTMAERAAWDFMDEHDVGFDLVVINPTGVIGPSIVPRLNQSHSLYVSATNGEIPGIIDLEFPIVDVRDVARAHILAMENPNAAGRYLCSAETRSMRQNFELLKEAGFGDRYKLPSLPLDNAFGNVLVRLITRFQSKGTRDFIARSLGRTFELDTTKIRTELGLKFRDVDQTVIDTMTSLESWGHLGKKIAVGAEPSRR